MMCDWLYMLKTKMCPFYLLDVVLFVQNFEFYLFNNSKYKKNKEITIKSMSGF